MTVTPPILQDTRYHPQQRAVPSRHRPRTRWAVDAATAVVGIGLGASMAVPISQATHASLRAPGGVAILAGDVTAMAGTYLLLVMVLLAARISLLERALGQEQLLRWHRLLSSVPLALLGAHAVLTTLGDAQAAGLGLWAEEGSLLTTMQWVFAAVVAYAMLMAIAGLSIRAVRRKVNYDTWWVIHLYTYLALAFSVPHQIFDGTNFAGHRVIQALWLLLWLGTAGVVVAYRIVVPIARTVYYRLALVQVRQEGPGVYSLLLRGRRLDRLAVDGGQYFAWRFLTRGMWWHAHPFSLSALPSPPYLRVTIKVVGDTTARIARLKPGTRVAIEGPYGAFTGAARVRHKVALIGAGVGITPLRALLEGIPAGVDVVVVQRASRYEEMIHRDEIASLVAGGRGRMVELVGSRRQYHLGDPRELHRVIPDLAIRDLYVCGPGSFAAGVAAAAHHLGVPPDAIHCESFEY